MPFRPRPGAHETTARGHRAGPASTRRRADRGGPSLSNAWRAWVAENILLGVAREDIRASLVARGVPRALAVREVEAIARDPLLAGARRVTRLAQRHQLVARARREVDKLATAPLSVERRSRLSWAEFVDRYYAASTPVVITDALAPWPSLSRWSPAYFKERFGDLVVEVTSGRDADPLCDPNFKAHSVATKLGDFCDRVTSAGTTNDFYLIANNRLTEQPEFQPVFDDVRAPHEYLDDRRYGGTMLMWFGPAGTVTPLHHDTANALFCQVYGRKKIVLFPPFELSLLRRMHHGVYSAIDVLAPDLEAFPEFADLARREVTLSPGEALFIPVTWWHHVRALEVSINIAFTNFRAPNYFGWYYPGSVT